MAGSTTARFPRPRGLAARWVWLTSAVVAAFIPAALLGQALAGEWGLGVAALSAGVCWFAASLALALSACVRGPQAPLANLAIGMGLRMVLPLGMFMWLSRYPELTNAGFVWQLGLFYLLTLSIETWLTLPDVDRSAPKSKLKAADAVPSASQPAAAPLGTAGGVS